MALIIHNKRDEEEAKSRECLDMRKYRETVRKKKREEIDFKARREEIDLLMKVVWSK